MPDASGRIRPVSIPRVPWHETALEASYNAYVASLEPCPGCGRLDEMDNITGQILCASCYLEEMSDDEDADPWDGQASETP